MKPKVYIIHSSADDSIALSVCRSLEENKVGCRCLNSRTVSVVEGPATRLIDKSDLIVLILSSAAPASARVRQEVERAAKANKIIIPFRIDSAPLSKYLEFYLSTAHWLDVSTPNLDQHLAQLGTTARRLMGLEKGYGSVYASMHRHRVTKRAVAAMISGVLSVIVGGSLIFGPLGVILGRIELKAIADGRSTAAGRRYARAGVICGLLGSVLSAAYLSLFLYMGADWIEDVANRLESLIWPSPLGPR